ncbi:glyoxal oxidase [Nitrosopumilus ureiphilus]|uniref:Galactose oxidase n=1 Tax=Nitrosopumilus ureiphilus TaxID=1470067 RepID=A0A7D5M8Z9_9ARCH|nr:glyoxal oxidase [Nitrosopumilus ureiphilus]QLH07530.1 hypothetical protein C5F50_10955 [Nitrosopumilus ureiphilus]
MEIDHQNATYEVESIAVHLALLRTGKVLLFSGDHENIWNWTKGESSLWDPEDPRNPINPKLGRNLFCSGHCFLPDGRLFVAGGQSTYNHPATIVLSLPGFLQLVLKIIKKPAADHDIHTFDPNPDIDPNQRWQRYKPGMPKARWYPTCVTLPDGKALIVSGTYSHAHHALFGAMNLDYEIFDPVANKLSTPVKFIDEIKMYPFLQVLPGGTLFVHSEETTHIWNIAEKKFITDAKFKTETPGTRTYPGMGSCVLLPLEHETDTAKILLVGGSTKLHPDKNTDATQTPEIFTADLNNPANSSGWKKTTEHIRRFLCDSILLPDGTVLVTNGAAKGQADDNDIAVREVHLFDPRNETWKVVSYLKRDRLYHGSAVLLPSGEVVVAGSTGHNWVRSVFAPKENFEHNIEIITPPKLQCNPTRPKIQDIELPTMSYNNNYEIHTDDASSIQKVSLIKISSTTHNNNMDQRCLMLPIINQTANILTVSSPKNNTFAPPGYYMLFILDGNDVPSVGKFVKVG